jgi:hypothetical protein
MWVLHVVAVIAVYGLIFKFARSTRRAPTSSVHHAVRNGVTVRIQAVDPDPIGGSYLLFEARASVLVPSGLRFLRRRNWGARALPETLAALADASIIERSDEGMTRSDTLASLPSIVGLAEPWRVLMHRENLLLGCDGRTVYARTGDAPDREEIDAIVDAVVAVARWDAGFTEMLAALPGACVVDAPPFAPAVVLHDGIFIGCCEQLMGVNLKGVQAAGTAKVVGGVVTAQGDLPAACSAALARAGDGKLVVSGRETRFVWAEVERDPDRILAAVEALRTLTVTSPYR